MQTRVIHAIPQNTPDDSGERQAVEACLRLIEARRLTTGTARGAFRMATNTENAWIEHYVNLEAMLALLAVTSDPNSKYIQWVGEYLEFYANDALQQPQGVAHNFDGPKNNPVHLGIADGINKDYDSIDSYAGFFLLASSRYYKITGNLFPRVHKAVFVSLAALNRVINDKRGVVRDGGEKWDFPNGALTNGLPIARADYPQHQLMDAVEIYAGLYESVSLFQKLKAPDAAKQAESLANAIVRGIRLFEPRSPRELYACRCDNGNNPAQDTALYPGILANLFAISYFPTRDRALRSRVWAMISAQSNQENASVTTERWLIAATRIASETGATADKEKAQMLRRKVIEHVKGFGSNTYLDRLAITVLVLQGPAAFLPVLGS